MEDNEMSYLDRVIKMIDMGMDEEAACREAYATMYPEDYDPEDYED